MVDVAKVKDPVPKNRPLFVEQFIELLELDKSFRLSVPLAEMAPEHP